MAEGTSVDGGLARYVADWSPRPVHSHDTISLPQAQALAATLDLSLHISTGDALPPLWQRMYFLDWQPTRMLGLDGHPREGGFLPPIPHRRRMFAGSRLSVASPLVLGEPAVRRTSVVATDVKHGRTGEMLFVTVQHQYSQLGETRLVEEQDLVYRSDSGLPAPFVRVTEPLAAATTPWSAHPEFNPALLFRFSALTGNAHRIHYDHPYATTIEGYPDLVVQGPLLAVYMAELLREHLPHKRLLAFNFQLRRPVFVGDEIRVQGAPSDNDNAASLAVISGNSSVHATATASLG